MNPGKGLLRGAAHRTKSGDTEVPVPCCSPPGLQQRLGAGRERKKSTCVGSSHSQLHDVPLGPCQPERHRAPGWSPEAPKHHDPSLGRVPERQQQPRTAGTGTKAFHRGQEDPEPALGTLISTPSPLFKERKQRSPG